MEHPDPRPATRRYRKPLPVITPLNKPFWDFALDSVFAVQVCAACGDAHIPESPVCPNCLGVDQAWKPSSGRGTLESWVDFHRAYWDGFADELPYRVGLVRLDEGPLFIGSLVGEADKARLGARVHAVFERIAPEFALPKFALD
jgi:uncharacterized protein